MSEPMRCGRAVISPINLGEADGNNVVANIPDYAKEKLLIDADIQGAGKAIGDYFMQTPLHDSLGGALQELQIGNNVSGRLHLDIPLDGEHVKASGDVTLNDNSLFIKPLESQIEHLKGQFSFDNGNLQSNQMTANWLGQPLNVQFKTTELPDNYKIQVGLNGNWQPGKLPGVPQAAADKLQGEASWTGNVDIALPHKGTPNYNVSVDADLKNVSSHLPEPLDKKSGRSLPLNIKVQGDLHSFMLSGVLAGKNRFNSRWLLGKTLTLDRAAWQADTAKTPALPATSSMTLHLPALDGENWLALLSPDQAPLTEGIKKDRKESQKESHHAIGFGFPHQITLTTPRLNIGGQAWNELMLQAVQTNKGLSVSAKGKEIDGSLDMNDSGPWLATLHYLYFNPLWSNTGDSKTASPSGRNPFASKISFANWPALNVRCEACWFFGQNFRRVEGDVTPQGDNLLLRNGLVDTGKAKLVIDGDWKQSGQGDSTGIKGKLSGDNIAQATSFFGVTTPLKDSPFSLDFDLHWKDTPWKPDVKTLNGVLKSQLGKGEISDLGGGRAGQLLRLVSFDALLRKLRLDFSDTFGKGFYYDSIKSTAWIKEGVLHTDDLSVDGLAADIAMSGSVDLVNRRLNMEAVITPEISATVGVATAFAINPIVGAAVFAATKVLGPLWTKISLIRYQIDGSIEQPNVHEILRQSKSENKAQAAPAH